MTPSNWVGGPGCPTNPAAGSSLIVGNLSCLNLAATPSTPAAVDSTDNNQPYSDSWSVNLDQQTPWQGLMEIGYVGNRSRDQLNTSGGVGSSFNLVTYGAMLSAPDPATANANNYRPLQGYGNVRPSHQQPVRQLQRACRSAGYGMRVDPSFRPTTHGRRPWASLTRQTTRSASVQTMARRPRIAETCSMRPTPLILERWCTRMHLVDGAVNGWQLSGITQLESGANLTYGGNISNQAPNLNYNMSLTCVATAAETGCRYLVPAIGCDHPGFD